MDRKIDVVDDFNGRRIVFIHDIIFKKKQYVEWKDVSLLICHSEDGKKYLYDIINIKKKRATRLSHKAVHDKNPFLESII